MDATTQKILITGGAGFIGTALAEYLSKSHKEIILLVIVNPKDPDRFNFFGDQPICKKICSD